MFAPIHEASCSSTALVLLRGKKFTQGDAFIGYQKDTPAAVVFQASNFLRRLREEDDENVIRSKLEVLGRAGILENVPLNVLLDREDVTDLWKEAVCWRLSVFHKIFATSDGCYFVFEQVLPLSQFLLLQTAAPDAIVRLQITRLEGREAIEEMYFQKLHLHSIEEFLKDQFQRCEGKGGLLIQVYIYTYSVASSV